MFNFDQVHQITHNVDYSYAFNGESLVFATRPPRDSTSGFDPSITNNKFTFKDIFLCILKERIIFPLQFGSSQSFTDSLSTKDDSGSCDLIFTSALAITNDSSNVVIGQNDGSLSILNLKPFLDSRLKSDKKSDEDTSNEDGNNTKKQYELSGNNYVNYKFIHKEEITNVAFLKGDRRVIIGDKVGMITLLSFVNSITCELVVQTTIINLKMPYLVFEVCSEDNIFAFASSRGFSVIRTGRRIEVLLCSEDENINPDICFSIEKYTKTIYDESNKTTKEKPMDRILICQNRSIFVFDIESTEKRKIEQWTFDLPKKDDNSNSQTFHSIIRCFIIKHSFFLLLFKDGEAVIVKDKTGEIVCEISDLPTNPNPSRIQLYENELIYFMKSDIVQKEIDFKLE